MNTHVQRLVAEALGSLLLTGVVVGSGILAAYLSGGTSRNVVAVVQAAGYAPEIIEYLQTGWTRGQLLALFAAAGLTAREALRETKSPAAELGLLD